MKKIIFALILIVLLAIFGCTEKERPVIEPKPEPETETVTEAETQDEIVAEPEEIPDVSPLATKQFLEPFDDYSWAREYAIEKVVVHFTSAVVNNRDNPYNIYLIRDIFVESGLSIHYIIDRDGKIYCYMPESRAAWHAGVGTYGDDEKYTNSMNKYSVGIELVAIGSEKDMAQYLHPGEYASLDRELIGFTDEQYTSLTALIKDICQRNEIEFSRDNVIGHDEYNEAKSDPGELFDWNRVLRDSQ